MPTPSLKILIVEDEVLIAETIKIYLEERGHSFTDAVITYEDALKSIHTSKPDVVLIDIILFGEKSGIDLAEEIVKNDYQIPFVFLTSQYDERILNKAIALYPQGYLIKPIQKESLWTTIELANNNFNATLVKNKLCIEDGSDKYFMELDDILYINADHVYIKIVTKSQGSKIVRSSLSKIYQLLDEKQFIHCHRSYVVNLKYVSKFDEHSFVINNEIVPISRSKRDEVKESLMKIGFINN